VGFVILFWLLFAGTNIQTNEEVAIKLVSIGFEILEN